MLPLSSLLSLPPPPQTPPLPPPPLTTTKLFSNPTRHVSFAVCLLPLAFPNFPQCRSSFAWPVPAGLLCLCWLRLRTPSFLMMRPKPASSLQKTYDECYLTCSTAVYFEGQVGFFSSVFFCLLVFFSLPHPHIQDTLSTHPHVHSIEISTNRLRIMLGF